MLAVLKMNSQCKFEKLAFALLMLSLVIGCHKKSQDPLADEDKILSNYANHVGVSSDDAPNDLLLEWSRFFALPESDLVQIDQVAIDSLKTAVSFDCTGYALDDHLKQALQEAPELRWLRIGRIAKSDDLPWICKLGNLRGLSLSEADMSRADFSLFRGLKDLVWLDMHSTELPQADFHAFSLPHLEVLFIDSESATNKHVPALGKFPNLRVLSAGYSQIDDDGIRQLVRANPELRHLHLYNVQGVTNRSVSEFAKLKRLRYLAVGLTPLAGEWIGKKSAVTILRRKMPSCVVEDGD